MVHVSRNAAVERHKKLTTEEKQVVGIDASQLPADASMEELMELYDESFKRFAEGEVVLGKIISVDKDHVLVDIGYKSEGQIRINEFLDEEGQIQAKTGDTVEVMVEWWDDEN
jgi:small subunit ribosomal protein S1